MCVVGQFSYRTRLGETDTLSTIARRTHAAAFEERTGTWGVIDFTRDGNPLSQTFEIVGPEGARSSGGVRRDRRAAFGRPRLGVLPAAVEAGSDDTRVEGCRTAECGRGACGRRPRGHAFAPFCAPRTRRRKGSSRSRRRRAPMALTMRLAFRGPRGVARLASLQDVNPTRSLVSAAAPEPLGRRRGSRAGRPRGSAPSARAGAGALEAGQEAHDCAWSGRRCGAFTR